MVKKLDYYLKEIDIGRGFKNKVWDYDKIMKSGFHIIVIISERGSKGKTYGAKQFIKKMSDKNKSMTMWLRNRQKDIDNEQTKFLKDTPPGYDGCEFSGSVKKNSLWLKDQAGNDFIKFQSINCGEDEKGSRVIYDYYVWDEFNVGMEKIGSICDNFDSIMHSGENVNSIESDEKGQVLIFGNYKSLSHPFLISLGITYISEDVTEIWEGDIPLCLILISSLTEEEKANFSKAHQNSWRMALSKRTGYLDHSYFNASLYDVVNRVMPLECSPFMDLYSKIKLVVRTEGFYIFIYECDEKILKFVRNKILDIDKWKNNQHLKNGLPFKWHAVAKKVNGSLVGINNIYYDSHNDKIEGHTLLPKEARMALLDLIHQDKMSFEDVISRELVFKISK